MSELQVVEDHEVLVPLDLNGAKMLDGKITSMVDGIGDRLALLGGYLREAEQGQIHLALGFNSWPAYLDERLAGRWALKGEERRRAAQMLASHGASTRAIASITGASKSTVARDISESSVPNGTDTPATQLDSGPDASNEPSVPNGTVLPGTVINTRTGKAQRRRKPRAKREPGKPKPAPPKAERKVQLPTAFRETVKAIKPSLDDLLHLTRDPRWDKARGRFTTGDRAALDAHIGVLENIRAAMDEQQHTTTAASA